MSNVVELEAKDTQSRILELLDEAAVLDRAGNRRGCWQAREELREVRRRLVDDFARARGWIVATTPFTPGQMRRGHAGRYRTEDYLHELVYPFIDHPEYFRWPTRPYRPAAILTHSYANPDNLVEFAAGNGLEVEVLPWSWYYPGQCTAALLTRINNVVELTRRPT